MIEIRLSERDFDYELQALINSFFPGQKSYVIIGQDEALDKIPDLLVDISFCQDNVHVKVCSEAQVDGDGRVLFWKYELEKDATVSGDEDWHKRSGKLAHPYRTYYKNVLKKMVFEALRDFNSEYIPEGIKRRVPAWGTMTGVRPTKIVMNEFSKGKDIQAVTNELTNVYCCSQDKVKLGVDIALREAELLRAVDCENGYSLYVGIPFCPTTCLYCSFTSYPYERFGYMADDYLSALKKELEFVSKVHGCRKPSSIYIGGGTPTTLTAPQLADLIGFIKEKFDTECEFTVEAGRPDSITVEKLKTLYDQGVRRISVNPQTMQQKTLDLIGRKHTVEQTINAFNMARDIGFNNINMDLIIGLPGEGVEEFEDTLAQIHNLNPDSITIHSLVVKRASGLRSTLEECGELGDDNGDKAVRMEKMLEMGHKYALSQGYKPYYMYRQKNSAGHSGSTGQENIGYARDGKECLYNILIMEEKQTIAAVGAGASTKLYHKDLGQVSRVENVKSVKDYIERIDEMIDRKRAVWC